MCFVRSRPASVAVQEEDRNIGHEHVVAAEPVAFGDQFAQQDVADDVVALFAGVLFVNLREVQDAVNVGIRVPDIYLQRDVGRIVGLLDIAQLLDRKSVV